MVEQAEREASPVQIGEVLAGKYRVERVLGVGGMGVVVAATHLHLRQTFALKFLLEASAKNLESVDRFLREARVVAQMRSEHVARVYDVGKLDSGVPYIVMEFLEGRTLADEMDDRGALPVDDVLQYVLEACEALAEAHALGIVHRDLKPDNLFLTRTVDGQPRLKVIDFGLAKPTGLHDRAHERISLTRSVMIMGTPAYMSPEQLRSTRDVDGRTDIWSLGVIAYEMLVGKLPFDSTSLPDLCAMVTRDAPPPITRSDVPERLKSVVLRALEKTPEDRFQSVAEVAEALAPVAGGRALSAVERITRLSGSVPPPAARSWPPEAASGERPVLRLDGVNRRALGVSESDVGLPALAPPPRRSDRTAPGRAREESNGVPTVELRAPRRRWVGASLVLGGVLALGLVSSVIVYGVTPAPRAAPVTRVESAVPPPVDVPPPPPVVSVAPSQKIAPAATAPLGAPAVSTRRPGPAFTGRAIARPPASVRATGAPVSPAPAGDPERLLETR